MHSKQMQMSTDTHALSKRNPTWYNTKTIAKNSKQQHPRALVPLPV
jgi:hypothetical protein